jgi:hypothetical protein
MAKLSKATIQKLAVLRALTLWKRGAYGPVRLQKTMFAVDKENALRLFTFKKYYLGQYSEEISGALNSLRAAGRLQSSFDGPSERLQAMVSPQAAKKIRQLFAHAFPEWEKQLNKAFPDWGYLSNNSILKKAHGDATFTKTIHDDVIFDSNIKEMIDIPELSDETAKELADLVDEKLGATLRKRIFAAVKVAAGSEDWRSLYFGDWAP